MSFSGGTLKNQIDSGQPTSRLRSLLKVWDGANWKLRPIKRYSAGWKAVDVKMTLPTDMSGTFEIAGDYSDIDTVTVSGSFDITSGYSDA